MKFAEETENEKKYARLKELKKQLYIQLKMCVLTRINKLVQFIFFSFEHIFNLMCTTLGEITVTHTHTYTYMFALLKKSAFASKTRFVRHFFFELQFFLPRADFQVLSTWFLSWLSAIFFPTISFFSCKNSLMSEYSNSAWLKFLRKGSESRNCRNK